MDRWDGRDSREWTWWMVVGVGLMLAGGCCGPAGAQKRDEGEMVRVPAGTLERGDATGAGYSDERPVRSVAVSGFLMDRSEVSWGLWVEVMQWATNHGYVFESAPETHHGRSLQHPVCDVTWYAAVKWCNARSEREGLVPVYCSDKARVQVYRAGKLDLEAAHVRWGANGYRLPTEAEWEWAARGGLRGQNYPWASPGTNLTEWLDGAKANYWGSGDRWESDEECATSEAGSIGHANGYGLVDMAGNVSEWCWDWYLEGWYGEEGSAVADARGPESGHGRALRGGSWISSAKYCRVSARYMSQAGYPCHCYGFRCVRRVP